LGEEEDRKDTAFPSPNPMSIVFKVITNIFMHMKHSSRAVCASPRDKRERK
jgi:hypothetical protein